MKKYAVLFTRNTRDRYFDAPNALQLMEEYAFMGTRKGDKEQIFFMMQGEHWSPMGEKRGMIRSLDLWHTSMSVGDVLIDMETMTAYYCASMGWKALKYSAGNIRSTLDYLKSETRRLMSAPKKNVD